MDYKPIYDLHFILWWVQRNRNKKSIKNHHRAQKFLFEFTLNMFFFHFLWFSFAVFALYPWQPFLHAATFLFHIFLVVGWEEKFCEETYSKKLVFMIIMKGRKLGWFSGKEYLNFLKNYFENCNQLKSYSVSKMRNVFWLNSNFVGFKTFKPLTYFFAKN